MHSTGQQSEGRRNVLNLETVEEKDIARAVGITMIWFLWNWKRKWGLKKRRRLKEKVTISSCNKLPRDRLLLDFSLLPVKASYLQV